jgi:hypothetical protein
MTKSKSLNPSAEDIEFKLVKIADIDLEANAQYNPNEMDEKVFKDLTKNMENYGYLAPCLVIPPENNDGKKYFIIDGAHRIMALQAKGETQAWVLVCKKVTKAMAFAGAVSFNKLRGELSGKKLAKMLLIGIKTFGESDIKKFTTLDQNKIEEYCGVLLQSDAEIAEKGQLAETIDTAQLVTRTLGDLKSVPVADMDKTIMLNYNPSEYEFVISVLEKMDKNNSKAVMKLCKFNEGS